jgi:hypothetical protein
MNKQTQSQAPLILAIVLLLLPLLYVGVYLTLVRPRGVPTQFVVDGNVVSGYYVDSHYPVCEGLCEPLFWPLEHLDRRLRPEAWDRYSRRVSH